MNLKYEHNYDDIINLEHHVSSNHPAMSLYARSAQFLSFDALKGYEDLVKETARETTERIEIDEEHKCVLDSKIQIIIENINKKPEVSFTYFMPDERKAGGTYITVKGIVRNVNSFNQCIYLVDGTEILINEIIEISGDIFDIFYKS